MFFTSDIASNYSETALLYQSFASLGSYTPHNPAVCWAIYQDGGSHALVSAGVHEKAHASEGMGGSVLLMS